MGAVVVGGGGWWWWEVSMRGEHGTWLREVVVGAGGES